MPFDQSRRYAMVVQRKMSSEHHKGEDRGLLLMIGASLVVFMFLIGAAYVIFSGASQPPQPPPVSPPVINMNRTTAANTIANDTLNTSDDQIILAALQNRNEQLCEKINASAKKQQCYEALAEYNLTTCLRVEDAKKIEECINKHAARLNSTEVCVNIKNLSAARKCRETVDPCYYKIGTEENTCRSLQKANYNLCYGDKECIYRYSSEKKNITACGLLAETAEQFACIAIVKNEDECAKLSLSTQADNCRYIYAVRTDRYLWCTAITPDTMYALWCYSHFASKNNTLDICDLGLSLDDRWECYRNYSIETRNVTGCAHINKYATSNIFNCFWSYAKLYGDASACDLMNDTGFRYSCYVGAIMNNTKLDYRHCENVSVIEWKNKCYIQSAKNAKNESLCNYIKTELERQSCIGTVQAAKK